MIISFCLILVGLLVMCVIAFLAMGVLHCIYLLIRNEWVFRVRMAWIEEDNPARNYISYEDMLYLHSSWSKKWFEEYVSKNK